MSGMSVDCKFCPSTFRPRRPITPCMNSPHSKQLQNWKPDEQNCAPHPHMHGAVHSGCAGGCTRQELRGLVLMTGSVIAPKRNTMQRGDEFSCNVSALCKDGSHKKLAGGNYGHRPRTRSCARLGRERIGRKIISGYGPVRKFLELFDGRPVRPHNAAPDAAHSHPRAADRFGNILIGECRRFSSHEF